jgi:hypothetical protein
MCRYIWRHVSPWRVYSHVAVIIFLLLPLNSYSTTIVAILSNNTVVIAADSREIITGIPGARPISGCKLSVVDNFAWSTSGTFRVFSRDPGTGAAKTIYDMNDFIGGIAKRQDTQEAKIERFDSSINNAIISEAKELQRTSPQTFDTYSNGRVFLEVLLIGFQHGRVTISHREYGLGVSKGKIAVGQNDWKPNCPGGGCRNPQAFFTGEREALNKFIGLHPEVLRSTDIDYLRKVAIGFVQTEIDAAPEKVGGSIETATIDGNGIHWGGNNTICPNGKQPSKATVKPNKSTGAKTR